VSVAAVGASVWLLVGAACHTSHRPHRRSPLVSSLTQDNGWEHRKIIMIGPAEDFKFKRARAR
jgi:hypothetical protein